MKEDATQSMYIRERIPYRLFVAQHCNNIMALHRCGAGLILTLLMSIPGDIIYLT